MQLSKSYQLIRKLAAGGMAEVFLARTDGPKGFSKTLVIKRILPHLAENEHFVEMFLSEARLVAQLNHPNVVQIFDFGEFEDAYFLAMEYIDGPNLRSLWRQAARVGEWLPPALCAKIISYACEGLAYAHDFVSPETGKPLGLIHRDVSGDNILVSRNGAVKVVDFGIAKVLGQAQQTKTGTVRGKLPYMPPEQIQAKPLDRRVDVFALGMVLYELLSARRPFDATGEMEIMNAILREPLKPIRQRRPDVPEALEQVLVRALAKRPSDRYPSCRHLRADLERFILSTGEPVGTYEVANLVERLFPRVPEATAAAAQTITAVNRQRAPTTPARTPSSSPPSRRKAAPSKPHAPPAAAPGNSSVPPRRELAEAPAPGGKGEPVAQPSSNKAESSTSWESTSATLSRPARRLRARLLVAVLGSLMAVSVASTFWAKRSRVHVSRVEVPLTGVAGPEVPRAEPKPQEPPREEPASTPTSEVPPAQVVALSAPVTEAEQPPSEATPLKALKDAPARGARERAQRVQPARETVEPEQEPSEEAAPAPAQPGLASVVIESSPPAQIRVNGRFAGLAPVTLRNLEPGLARVEVYDSFKGFSKEQELMLEPGDNGMRRVVVGQGTLELRIQSSAVVFLDGRSLGRTPLEPLLLYEGRHSLRLESETLSKPVVVPVIIEAGKTQVLQLELTEE